jgi:hypothetical protein
MVTVLALATYIEGAVGEVSCLARTKGDELRNDRKVIRDETELLRR